MTNWPASNLPDEAQAWRRKMEEELDAQKRTFKTWQVNGAALQKAQESLSNAIADANLTIKEQTETVADARRVPAAPADAQVSANAYFDEYGRPQATVWGSCAPVLKDTNGNPIEVSYHEMYGRPTNAGEAWQKLADSYALPPEFKYAPLPGGEQWDFCMAAVSIHGVVGERSAVLTVTLTKDTTPPPQPSAPTCTARLGQVMVNWDGLTSGGQTQPADFSHCEVLMASSSGGSGYKVGTIDKDGDTFYAPEQEYNATRWFYLVAVDYTGNRSLASTRVSVAVTPLVNTDLIGRVIDGVNVKLDTLDTDVLKDNAVSMDKLDSLTRDTINNAAADAVTANGRVTTSLNAPTVPDGAGKPVGALWYRNDAAGGVIGMWEWTGTAWSPREFQNAVFGSIDAAKITTGIIDAGRIGANTITAEKIAIGDFENLVDGSGFEDAATIPWNLANAPGTITHVTTGPAHSGTGALEMSSAGTVSNVPTFATFNVQEGDGFYVELWAYRDAAYNGTAGNAKLSMRRTDTGAQIGSWSYSAAAVPTASTWTLISGTGTVPAGVTRVYFVLFRDNTAGSIVLDDIVIRRRSKGELLVDGAITARTLAAGAVTAGKIAANSIGANEIVANSITGDEIAANAITASELAALSVEAGHIKANAVTADKIEAGAITTVKLAAGAVTADKIEAGAITTVKLAAGAVTANAIAADAINGKTITGALIRTAASGARTEMNTSGIRVINSSSQELLRIGYGISTGMSIRNPGTGSLVPLSDAAFGSVTDAKTDSLGYAVPVSETSAANGGPGTWGPWSRHTTESLQVVFTAVAPVYLINFGQVWSAPYAAGHSVQVLVAPTVNGTRLSATNGPYFAPSDYMNCSATAAEPRMGPVVGSVPINTTVGTAYTIQLQFRTNGWGTSAPVAVLANRFIVATPVFN
ncbi:hypothetical protein [Microbacterium sp.]|uniref:hypothetical protein n=1 Tax=Microbacterium sp. TaxID=51671 RepID=UPI0039E6FC30